MLRWMTVWATVLLLAACGSTSVSVSPGVSATTPAASPSLGSPASPATNLPQSASPPITPQLDLDPQQLAIGKATPVTLRITLDSPAERVRGRVIASGVASVGQAAEQEWTNVATQQTLALSTTVQISGQGPGTIVAVAEVLDPAGNPVYGRDIPLFVLATDLGVLTGTAGPQELRREYLERARAAGVLTQDEYDRALEQNQYGGAQESITIIVPTPVP